LEIIRLCVISKGAEAIIFKELWYGIMVVRKVRIPKKYRSPMLDLVLRRQRTSLEAKLLIEAKSLGVPVPTVFEVDLDNTYILMEFIEGMRLRDFIPKMPLDERIKSFTQVGNSVGRLHAHGIVHGDLTTSNMILTSSGNVYLIDFGLGMFSSELEDRGVDIHLMLRALESTHAAYVEECFKAFLKGYESVMGVKETRKILNKVKEIRSRGRYVSERRVR